MVPGSWPYGAPSTTLGQSVTGSPGTGLGFSNGSNHFAIPSAPAFAFAPSLYGAYWPEFIPPGYYQAQTSSAPQTYGGWIWNGLPSTTYPASTSPNQTQVPSASSGTSFAPFSAPTQPRVSSTSAGTAPWGSSTSSTASWNSFFPASTFASLNEPQASSSSTGTTFWGSLPSTTLPTFAFPSQSQAPSTTAPLFGGPQTAPANGSLSSGLSSTSFVPQGNRVASYVPTPDDSGSNGYLLSISAMPVYQNKSHEELRLEGYQTLSDKGPQTSLPFVSSTVSFLPQGGAVSTDIPASNDEKFISISATPAYSNKSHEELRLEHYNASGPIQLHTSSSATPNGLGPSCCCGSLFQKQKSAGAETLVNLLTSALSSNTFPIGIGLAGQFSPDVPVLCQLQSLTSAVPTGAATSSTQTSSSTAFTWPEPGRNTASQKTPNVSETPVSNGQISGQSTEGAFKPGIPFTSSFGLPFTFPPSPAPTVPRKTENVPETLVSTNKISGQTTEGALKSETPFGVPFMFSPSPASTSQHGISSIPTLNYSAPIEKASLPSSRSFISGQRCCSRAFEKYKKKNEGWKLSLNEPGICESTPSLIPRRTPVLNWDGSLETELHNLSLLEQKSSNLESGNSDDTGTPKDGSGSSAKIKLNISVPLDAFEADEVSTHDVEAMMPKLRSLDYYTIPSIQELVEKELIEPGFCCRVKDFVVGRRGYGCIKFLGETDVRNLDLESLIKFDSRELTLFESDGQKPEAGQGLKQPAEVTLLNVKCIDKSTGKEYVDGPKVDKFIQMLIRKVAKLGVEFVSYVPATGEWKFMVQHF